MLKYTIVISLSFCFAKNAFTQIIRNEKFIRDSSFTKISSFEDNKDGSVYTGMYEILKGLAPVTYVGVAAFIGFNRPYALIEGEGKNGYVFEASLDQLFTIAQGRNGSNHFWQRGKIAARYAPAFRMTNDSSLPLIPSNQKIGLEIDYAIWNNYTLKEKLKESNLYYAKDTNWINQSKTFKVVHLIFNAMHFSNGQPPGVFYRTIPVKRNDYKKGDFSTNYLSLMAVYSLYTKAHRLFSAGLGLRFDGELGDALAFNPAQVNRYGKSRIEGLLQYRTKPKFVGNIKDWEDVLTGQHYKTRNKISFRHRLELEYILGNMINFDRAKKTRLGIHFFEELELASSRTIGFVFHYYYGRDYMNIRYDDIVSGGNLGLTFNLSKYKPPRQKSSSFIVSPMNLQYNVENKNYELIRQN